MAPVRDMGVEQRWMARAQSVFDDPVFDERVVLVNTPEQRIEEFVGDAISSGLGGFLRTARFTRSGRP